MHLYLIPLKYESLVKVGVTEKWPITRWRELGLDRLEPERACLLHGHRPIVLLSLEKTLKEAFAAHRREAAFLPLNDDQGKTETFDEAVYPAMLHIVRQFALGDPYTGQPLTGLTLERWPEGEVLPLDEKRRLALKRLEAAWAELATSEEEAARAAQGRGRSDQDALLASMEEAELVGKRAWDALHARRAADP